MAKGQKRSTKEPRKPKQAKPKPAASRHAPGSHSIFEGLDRPPGMAPPRPTAHPTGPRR